MKNNLKKISEFIIEHNTVFIFIILLAISSFISNVFFTATNLSNLVRQVAGMGIVSMGMLLVILTGGIDLSVGSVMAMSGVFCAIFSHSIPLTLAVSFSIFHPVFKHVAISVKPDKSG